MTAKRNDIFEINSGHLKNVLGKLIRESSQSLTLEVIGTGEKVNVSKYEARKIK